MKYRKLGRTDLQVSALCLGSMTWGEQNNEHEGFAQIDCAKASGVNFIDTAEMYPVPPRGTTYGATETIIGNYFRQRKNRPEWILASKIAGPGNGIDYIRDGKLKHNRAHIVRAIDASLRRLHTDWIDLYQLHWPERKTNYFGQRSFILENDTWEDNINAVLIELQSLIKQGKIKHIGLSNETPWGVSRVL